MVSYLYTEEVLDLFDLKLLGQKIKNRRLELNITQEDLAKMAGYTSRSSINKVELGLVDLPQSKLVAIANALEISPIELLGYSLEDESPSDELFLTAKERALIKSYRAHFELRCKIDTLLGLTADYEELYAAAHSDDNRPPQMLQIAKADWERIANAPDTEEELK